MVSVNPYESLPIYSNAVVQKYRGQPLGARPPHIFALADAAYRQALNVVPGHPRALHLLGMVANLVGRHGVAVKLIRQAIKRRPNVPLFHNNLGKRAPPVG